MQITRSTLRSKYLEIMALSRGERSHHPTVLGKRHPVRSKSTYGTLGTPIGGPYLMLPPPEEDSRPAEELLHIDTRARAYECLVQYDGHFLLQFKREERTAFCKALLKGVSQFYPPESIPSLWRSMVEDPELFDEIAVAQRNT